MFRRWLGAGVVGMGSCVLGLATSTVAAAPDTTGESLVLWNEMRDKILPDCRTLFPRQPENDIGVRLWSDKESLDLPHILKDAIAAAKEAFDRDDQREAQPQKVFRAAEVILPSPVVQAAAFWRQRHAWDPDSNWSVHVLEDYTGSGHPGERLIVVKTSRKPFISEPREFVLLVKKIENPPGAPPGSIAYVYTDQKNAIRPTKGVVRGSTRAVILLSPYTPRSTRCVYCFHIDFAGVLPALVFEGAADEEAMALGQYKRFIVDRVLGHG